MIVYYLTWVNIQGVESSKYFFEFNDLMRFVTARTEEGSLQSFVWDIK